MRSRIDPLEWESLIEKESYLQVNDNSIQFSKGERIFPPILSPPLEIPFDGDEYLEELSRIRSRYLIVLLQAGNGAIGYGEDGYLEEHKIIRKYMVRKTQGKSQLSYLKTKGKSRLGSRIRLKQSKEFFREINAYIDSLKVIDSVEAILVSCTPNLWGAWFNGPTPVPFEKKDSRVKKIPLYVDVPNFDELCRVNKLIQMAWSEKV